MSCFSVEATVVVIQSNVSKEDQDFFWETKWNYSN